MRMLAPDQQLPDLFPNQGECFLLDTTNVDPTLTQDYSVWFAPIGEQGSPIIAARIPCSTGPHFAVLLHGLIDPAIRVNPATRTMLVEFHATPDRVFAFYHILLYLRDHDHVKVNVPQNVAAYLAGFLAPTGHTTPTPPPTGLDNDPTLDSGMTGQHEPPATPVLVSRDAGITIRPLDGYVIFDAPDVALFNTIADKFGFARRTTNGPNITKTYRTLPSHRFGNIYTHLQDVPSTIPFTIDRSLYPLSPDYYSDFDGSISSLETLPVSVLANAHKRNWTNQWSKPRHERLADMGIHTLHDLIWHVPNRYESTTVPLTAFSDVTPGVRFNLVGTIVDCGKGTRPHTQKNFYLTLRDQAGEESNYLFFGKSGLAHMYHVGDHVMVYGLLDPNHQIAQGIFVQLTNPDAGTDRKERTLTPVYAQSQKYQVDNDDILEPMEELFARLDRAANPNGDLLIDPERHNGYTAWSAMHALHFPATIEGCNDAKSVLELQELTYLQVLVLRDRTDRTDRKGIPLTGPVAEAATADAIESLPFTLTPSQQQGWTQIEAMLSEPTPAAILLNADVGAGKTALGYCAIARTVAMGHTAVVLAPTEILARQLHTAIATYAGRAEGVFNVGLIAGSAGSKERKAVVAAFNDGTTPVIVGTTAILADQTLNFDRLGLVVIDEQQRFGTQQRTQLLTIRPDGVVPHLLMQTATPIPRTITQTLYGDLDIVLLEGKPPGRQPIKTIWDASDNPGVILADRTNALYQDLTETLQRGEQIFVVVTRVATRGEDWMGKFDGRNKDTAPMHLLKVADAADLIKKRLPGAKVGTVHGRMSKAAQHAVMEEFRSGALNVLVASTVVEVGVDVPNATRMVIANANLLGASTLHQTRGRIGRNSLPATCYLLAGPVDTLSKSAITRLEALVDFQDGGEIAQIDLDTRGEGTLFQDRQSGATDLRFTSIMTCGPLLQTAKEEAARLLNSPERERAIDAAIKFFNNKDRSK